METVEEGSTRDGEIKTVIAGFCTTAKDSGSSAATHDATVQLVAAAAYLEQVVGPARTRMILSATIAAIGSATELKH